MTNPELEEALRNEGYPPEIIDSVVYAEDVEDLINTLAFSRDELSNAITFLETYKEN